MSDTLQGSIIIPVLNEASTIAQQLQRLRTQLSAHWEIIVVDGGSTDDTCQQARFHCDQLIVSGAGRSVQMNRGASVARGQWLVFLHADTCLPDTFEQQLVVCAQTGRVWGRFDVQLDGNHVMFPVIAWLMNHRSRLTGIATGDQTLFMRAAFFQQLNGFSPIPLMEDIEFCRRARREQRPFCSRSRVTTSARKWQKNGVTRTILLMWWIRLAYLVGVPPSILHRWYYPTSCQH